MKGRPSSYDKAIADELCLLVSTTPMGLRAICRKLDIEYTTVKRWLIDNEAFRAQYAYAKEEQADHMAEEILEIADDSRNDLETRYNSEGEAYVVENKEVVNRSRLRIDARKWIASKLKPKKYGDKIDLTTDGEKINQTIIKWGDKEIQV